jgi:hypothetical protein
MNRHLKTELLILVVDVIIKNLVALMEFILYTILLFKNIAMENLS